MNSGVGRGPTSEQPCLAHRITSPEADGKPSASWTLDSEFSRLTGRLSSRKPGLSPYRSRRVWSASLRRPEDARQRVEMAYISAKILWAG